MQFSVYYVSLTCTLDTQNEVKTCSGPGYNDEVIFEWIIFAERYTGPYRKALFHPVISHNLSFSCYTACNSQILINI